MKTKIVLGFLLVLICAVNLTAQKKKTDSLKKSSAEISGPVILIHGIGGSDLRQKPTKGAFSDGGFPNDVLKFIAGDPQKLQFDETGKPRPDVFESGNIYAAGFYDVPGRNMTDLSKFLQKEGYQINKTLFEFAYDFRYPVAHSADKLSELVGKIKKENGASQVDIIGHSMGGLVAKMYLADESNAENVRKLIFVGTPHLGSPKALKALRYGDNLEVAIIDGCKLKRVAHNMPSMFSLLPGKKYFAASGGGYFYDDDDLDGDGTRGLLDYQQTIFNLENGRETKCKLRPGVDTAPFEKLSVKLLRQHTIDFHDKLDEWSKPEKVTVYNIVGYGVKTVKFLREKAGDLSAEYTTEGDGTVPLWSGDGVESDAVYYVDLKTLNTEHSAMIGNKTIGDQIFNLITKDAGIYTRNISSARPEKTKFKLKMQPIGKLGN